MTQEILGGGGGVSAASSQALVPPKGLQELVATFGDIYGYIRADGGLDPRWQADELTRVELPFALVLSWDRERSVSSMICHRRLAGVFGDVFERISASGMRSQIQTFGGCFAFRPQRHGSKLSTHAWGIAVDLNPESNMQGTQGNMFPGVIQIFREAGFQWGGDWVGKKRDAMHFQFCSGY